MSLSLAPSLSAAPHYDIGSTVTRQVWVDASNGNDNNGGTSRGDALRTLTEAWNRIPRGATLTGTGYRIELTAGTYAEDTIPQYLESRYGTAQFPIIIESVDGSRAAHLTGDLNVFDTRYFYLLGLDIAPQPAGDAFHCELCDHVLIRDCRLDGGDRAAHDMTKVNQSRYVYIEDSSLAGADDNTIDFVAVQYGHVVNNKISNAQDWCMYAKGGSAYLTIEGNEIFGCGTGGFTAGQGTGFQFMVAPWLQYEAYDIKVINNLIHDTEGAGLGVNGGYDILLAHNTLVRVGSRSHMLEIFHGSRSCDGQTDDPTHARCAEYLAMGGWGTTAVDDGTNYVRIPNRNIYVYNNLFYNPPGFTSPQIFNVAAPFSGPQQQGSNAPSPAYTDTNLVIRGNVIFNSGGDLGISDDTGCSASNPTCNEGQLRAENTINAFEPQLDASYRPIANSNVLRATTYAIPPFTWSDVPSSVPVGTLDNIVARDRDNAVRSSPSTAGAYAGGSAHGKHRSVRH